MYCLKNSVTYIKLLNKPLLQLLTKVSLCGVPKFFFFLIVYVFIRQFLYYIYLLGL